MVEFGGWDMPVQYPAGTVEEHLRTRNHSGLFDVSHMGEIDVRGPDAIPFVNRLTSNDVTKLTDGQAQYSALTTPSGTVVDDLLVYRLSADHLLLVVNAGTTDKDWNWVSSHHEGENVELRNASSEYCQLAIQGPEALSILQKLTDLPLADIKYYHFTNGTVDGVASIVSRTGYTGEDGFEIFVPPQSADRVWQAILESGRAFEVIPCGLGARDTLRLEAGMRLHGNDIDETTTALEADLGWIVGWKKDDFLGAAALRDQKARGVARRIVGFEMVDRGIARHGYDAYIGDEKAGIVTSGTQTPYLRKAIGMAYLPADRTAPGTEFDVDIRGRRTRAQVVPMPFYKRPK